MLSTILATIAFMVIIEGIFVALASKSIKKALYDLIKKKDASKTILKIGLWEILIGVIALVVAIIIRSF
jgi:uncharacterized protein YjeT (DUF2065 family)